MVIALKPALEDRAVEKVGHDLKFVSLSAPLDLHLTAASPATVRDVAGVTACSGPDIDGDLRPQGGLCDFGADENK